MKYLLLTLLFSSNAFCKDIYTYTCEINKDLKVEISLLDQTMPTIDLLYKNSKYAKCLYNNTPMSQMGNPRAHVQDSVWVLELKECTYYFEAHKNKIEINPTVTFSQGYKNNASFITVVKNHQPYTCIGKKQ